MRPRAASRQTGESGVAVRLARRRDIPELLGLHRRSLHELGGLYYEPRQIEALLTRVGTLDPDLIDDGTYLIAECRGRIVGCGGWTVRTPAYEHIVQRDPSLEHEGRKPAGPRTWAHIRGVFVDPAHARRGIARRIMTLSEEAAVLQGQADGIELLATLSGIPLYFRMGYRAIVPVTVPLGGDDLFFGMHMAKVVDPDRTQAAA